MKEKIQNRVFDEMDRQRRMLKEGYYSKQRVLDEFYGVTLGISYMLIDLEGTPDYDEVFDEDFLGKITDFQCEIIKMEV